MSCHGQSSRGTGTREEQAPNLRLLCSGQVPRATLGSGSGLRAKSWRLVHRPHPCIRSLSTLPNDKATREFCFRRAPGVLEGTYIHAAVGTAKEGALRAGLCCRRGGALSTLVDPQLCYPSEASLGGLEVTVLAGLGQQVPRSPVLTVKGNSCCEPTPKEDARAATVESTLDLALSSRG
jgi:hypothetical protein